jgi:hypothetical protein
MQLTMTEVVSDDPMDTDSAEEGEIRDSEDERRRSRPSLTPSPRKSPRARYITELSLQKASVHKFYFVRVESKRSTAPRRPPPSKRRPVRVHPTHRKKRRHRGEEEEDDVETMIAKTRRRMQASGSKDVFSIPKETAAVPRSSPAIPVEAAAVSKEPQIAKKAEEVDEVASIFFDFYCILTYFYYRFRCLKFHLRYLSLWKLQMTRKASI